VRKCADSRKKKKRGKERGKKSQGPKIAGQIGAAEGPLGATLAPGENSPEGKKNAQALEEEKPGRGAPGWGHEPTERGFFWARGGKRGRGRGDA